MKIVYYFDKTRPEKEKAVVRSIYGEEIQFIAEKPWSVIDLFDEGDFLICNSVDDLLSETFTASDPDAIVKEYINIQARGIDLIFDRSTQCNSLFIKTLTDKDQDFETVLRKCVMNYASQRDIAVKYSRKHVVTANSNGRKVGIKKGTKLVTKKSLEKKEKIARLSRDFDGHMDDEDVITEIGIARNTYYKYKKELRKERKNGSVRP